MIHTHYHRPSLTLFTLEQCETCGQDIQGPNAVKSPSMHKLIRAGVKLVDDLPPEGWYNDETGMEACDGCDGADPTPRSDLEVAESDKRDEQLTGAYQAGVNAAGNGWLLEQNQYSSATPDARACARAWARGWAYRDAQLVLKGVNRVTQ